jgi:hypothetical protein
MPHGTPFFSRSLAAFRVDRAFLKTARRAQVRSISTKQFCARALGMKVAARQHQRDAERSRALAAAAQRQPPPPPPPIFMPQAGSPHWRPTLSTSPPRRSCLTPSARWLKKASTRRKGAAWIHAAHAGMLLLWRCRRQLSETKQPVQRCTSLKAMGHRTPPTPHVACSIGRSDPIRR